MTALVIDLFDIFFHLVECFPFKFRLQDVFLHDYDVNNSSIFYITNNLALLKKLNACKKYQLYNTRYL